MSSFCFIQLSAPEVNNVGVEALINKAKVDFIMFLLDTNY